MDLEVVQQDLRGRLAQRLGIEEVDPALWNVLWGLDLFDRVQTYEENLDVFQQRYCELEAIQERPRRGVRKDARVRPSRESREAVELKRLETIDILVANRLKASEHVKHMHQRLGNGFPRALHSEDLEDLIWGEAARTCPPEFFAALGIPLAESERDFSLSKVRRSQDSAAGMVTYSAWQEPPGMQVIYTQIEPYEHVIGSANLVIESRLGRDETLVWKPSFLYLLARFSEELARVGPWTKGECAWFLLSGEEPMRKSIIASLYSRKTELHPMHEPTICLEIPLWVSPETVEEVYRQKQRDALGHHQRGPAMRNLEVIYLVELIRGIEKKHHSWQELVQIWNQVKPAKWHYKDTPGAMAERQFSRDYYRTLKLLKLEDLQTPDDDAMIDRFTPGWF